MVGVDVRQHVRADGAAPHLAQDAPGGVARAGVDDDVPDEVHVDRVRGATLQQEDVLGDALHVRVCSQEKPRTASTTRTPPTAPITASEEP